MNHASVLIESEESVFGILSDPWYHGGAFNDGWRLLFENNPDEVYDILEKTTHIYLSHEHPDHFSIKFFKVYKDFIKRKDICLIFQKTKDRRVISFINSLGLDYLEVEENKYTNLRGSHKIKLIREGFYDSALEVICDGINILNLNDCNFRTPSDINRLGTKVSRVDILLTQFSYAAWKGGPKNKIYRQRAASEKVETLKNQITYLKPRACIPFASFAYFSWPENFYLNDSVNTPDIIFNQLGYYWSGASIVFMAPMTTIDLRIDNLSKKHDFEYSSANARKFWALKYAQAKPNISARSSTSYEVLQSVSKIYFDRIHLKNSTFLICLARHLTVGYFFSPIKIRVSDLDVVVSIDIWKRKFGLRPSDSGMIEMHSNDLYFLFANSFGFDTLTINGMFFELQHGSFPKVARSLSLDNLNNIGYKLKFSIIFDLKIVFKFLSRLNRVKKNLKV